MQPFHVTVRRPDTAAIPPCNQLRVNMIEAPRAACNQPLIFSFATWDSNSRRLWPDDEKHFRPHPTRLRRLFWEGDAFGEQFDILIDRCGGGIKLAVESGVPTSKTLNFTTMIHAVVDAAISDRYKDARNELDQGNRGQKPAAAVDFWIRCDGMSQWLVLCD